MKRPITQTLIKGKASLSLRALRALRRDAKSELVSTADDDSTNKKKLILKKKKNQPSGSTEHWKSLQPK